MGKKTWLSMYPSNVASEQNRPYVPTSTPSSKPGWNSHLKYPRHFGGKSHGHPERKDNSKAVSIFLFD